MGLMRQLAVVALICQVVGCTPSHTPPISAADTEDFIAGALRPWGAGRLAITDPDARRFAVYDSALVALVMLRRGRRDDAGLILAGLAAVQADDGALPFSFTAPGPDKIRFVRSGAVAWVGYAATEYLDAESGGHERALALRLAVKAATYLLAHRVGGLVTGGEGDIRYEVDARGVHERIEPTTLEWISVEHNIDTYFFLRALARVTESPAYAEAASQLAAALSTRGWREDRGQLARGIGDVLDPVRALDCASWGAVFLAAIHDSRASRAYETAEHAYAVRDPRTGTSGHRPYADGPIFEDPRLQQFYQASLPSPSWDRLSAVWPEGSAGVALAALRTGHVERARAILDQLEPLRMRGDAMPTFTLDIPFTFDTEPSIAGTAWVELVRFEIARGPDRPTLWVQ
ncbi:hypothetical protein BH11MYX1_BH11MYX1_24620 [soil metagenome]